ncbi:MAG: hypothetical protein LBE91_15445 [Tannerella sp.]|jgi:hypothetical protein|nr:hypothetical protein [Tannerella sp.]
MINKITIGILIIVNVSLCFLCVWAYKARDNYLSNEKKDESIRTQILENDFVYGLTNDNLIINSDFKVTDLEGSTFLLKEIIGDSIKAIVRFADTNCEECLRFITVKLIRLTQEKQWNKNNFLFLASYPNSRNLKIVKDRLHIDFPVYLAGDLAIPAENLNAPYCFTIDSTMRTKHWFLPDKFEGRYSNIYFDMIGKRYFEETKKQ